MRIAWTGPRPKPGGGGVPGVAWLLVQGLSRLGHELDLYLDVDTGRLDPQVTELEGVRVVGERPNWHWNRWYSRNPISAYLTSAAARVRARRRLGVSLAEEHRRRPYDVVYQLSAIEMVAYRRKLAALPPVVLHPEVHLAGEVRAWRREQALVRRCESLPRRLVVSATMRTRALRQSRDAPRASRVVAISRGFAAAMAEDYGVAPDRFVVVPNPVDVERFHPPDDPAGTVQGRPVRLLFVGRVSLRKGIDSLVRLSHDLHDLAGQVELRIVGGRTMWSDFRPLLDDLNPAVATCVGPSPPEGVQAELHRADLLLQPSSYEPFGLTVAEALASGVPVVASNETGAVEDVPAACCWKFPAGDRQAFEAAVREAIGVMRGPAAADARRAAREEAVRLFSPDVVAAAVAGVLEEAAGRAGGPVDSRGPLDSRGPPGSRRTAGGDVSADASSAGRAAKADP